MKMKITESQFKELSNGIDTIEPFSGKRLFIISGSRLKMVKSSDDFVQWKLSYDEYKKLENLSNKTKELNDLTDEHISLLKQRKIGYDQKLEEVVNKIVND